MIRPHVFLIASAAFLAMFIVHVVVWRMVKPKNDINALLAVFGALPVVAGLALFFAFRCWFTWNDFLFSALLYFAFAGAYLQTYPAIQANTPTLVIVGLIGRSKSGINFDAIQRALTERHMVSGKIEEMIHEGFIVVAPDQSVSLTGRGKIWANAFIAYRKLLGLPEGEG